MVNTIRKCPSGALSYSFDDFEHRDPNERAHIVTVSKDGAYIITGAIELILNGNKNIQFGEGASKEHYTLCRRDGRHKVVNFNDEKS